MAGLAAARLNASAQPNAVAPAESAAVSTAFSAHPYSRVLRPGGLFHIVLPLEVQPWTFYRLVTRMGWKAKLHHCGHIQLFDANRFEVMSKAEGMPVRGVQWSFHWLYSLVDIGYFSFLEVRGPAATSVEDYLAHRRDVPGVVLRWVKDAAAAFGWYESRLLRRIPSGVGHFTCVRDSRNEEVGS